MVKLTQFSIHLLVCFLLIALLKCFVVVCALEKTSDLDEFTIKNTIKNHRTRMRQKYILSKVMNNEDSDKRDKVSIALGSGSIESGAIPEELPALIVDYANMIRNDIILLDNSVQTRTRKRGSVITENRQGIQDVPCSCEEDGKKLIFLGEDYVPRTLETRYCNDKLCPPPYGCKIRSHNITVLKRKKLLDELSQEDLPEELKRRWVAVKKPVIVGCTCSKGYIENY